MVRLSQYPMRYSQGDYQDKPWQFWTEQQKSQVIYKAYNDHYLTSKEVKKYLNVSHVHMLTQYVVPALSALLYFRVFKNRFASFLYRRSPTIGFVGGLGFVGITSILWLNLSPFYLAKQSAQIQILDKLYHKVGTSMRMLNDLVPRTRTSTDIDVRTRMLYSKRNGMLAGYLFAQEDHAPPINVKNETTKYATKKIYQ